MERSVVISWSSAIQNFSIATPCRISLQRWGPSAKNEKLNSNRCRQSFRFVHPRKKRKRELHNLIQFVGDVVWRLLTVNLIEESGTTYQIFCFDFWINFVCQQKCYKKRSMPNAAQSLFAFKDFVKRYFVDTFGAALVKVPSDRVPFGLFVVMLA